MIELDDLLAKGRFKDGGRGPYEFDCWGLACEVYRRYGKTLSDYRISAMDYVKIGQQMADESPMWVKVKPPLPVPCLVVIRLACGSWANHVGVYIGDGKFIHAYSASGICVTRIYDPGWKNKILGYYVPRE
ncbi:C40 family peptidase [Sporomusa sp. KB1]|jgi:probable lipoprotein NlpC|uniref:C40 family peptidase n=1 Tax=Sporomusa sp. KB1 TaxID=943346 RepID=UPI00119F5F53|nr:NlpC/P60 family protein [Sporomusa sp. KB1]TWH49588.1 Cell wall-associated hydrolases (invasion-associated proteins) [Sporomusa sp. KB1]